MAHSFNLLHKPWLPCVNQEDSLEVLSLLDTVTRAHELRGVETQVPVINAALTLFLIAFTKRIFDPEDDEAWAVLWQEGLFPSQKILDYAQNWEDRFDLFDPDHPFYQDPKLGTRQRDLQELDTGKQIQPKSITSLVLHLASGNNATLFDHNIDSKPRIYTPAATARLLIMLQAYSLGGMSSAAISKVRRKYKDSAFARGILFLSKGETLFETLLMNLVPRDYDPLKSDEQDRPVWEKADPFAEEVGHLEGMLDLLTWQSRRLLLIPAESENGETIIENFFPLPGYPLSKNFKNPFYHNFLITDGRKQSLRYFRFQAERALWRDSGAILDVQSNKELEPALAIHWSAHLQDQEILPRSPLRLVLYGMCTEPGRKKAYFYAQETFSAPADYLQDPQKLENLKVGLSLAEEVHKALLDALRELAEFNLAPFHDLKENRQPSGDDVRSLLDHWNAKEEYWRLLEPAFYRYLMDLPDSGQAHLRWWEDLKNAARKAFSCVSEQVGTEAAGLKGCVKAEKTLNGLLYKLFYPLE